MLQVSIGQYFGFRGSPSDGSLVESHAGSSDVEKYNGMERQIFSSRAKLSQNKRWCRV